MPAISDSEKNLPFNPDCCYNEREVESKLLVSYLLPVLGYSPYLWHQQVYQHRFRLDFVASASQAQDALSVVMEAKHPRVNLNEHLKQLSDYMLTDSQIKYGLLTNGREIRIYERKEDSIQFVFQCFGHGIEKKVAEIRALIGRQELSERLKEPIRLPVEKQPETPERPSEMKIITVYHNKGGVGKTTTVVNLAAALSEMGKRVLVVDMDSQANTTFAMGLVKFVDEEEDDLKDCNVYHVLSSRTGFPISEVARKASSFSSREIDVIPSHINIMQQEDELRHRFEQSRQILYRKLKAVEEHYDIVLIDTPPSLNLYARTALLTGDYLIIPSDLKPFANEGLRNVQRFVEDVNYTRQEDYQRRPVEILGVLCSKISTNPQFRKATLPKRIEKIENRYHPIKVLTAIISEREELAKCTEQVLIKDEVEFPDPKSVLDFAPHSKSAEEFRNLASEVLQKIG